MPSPGKQQDWVVYKEQMSPFHHGDAMWEPAPGYNYNCIKLGDVGFIRRGHFHLMFSAGCALGTRRLGIDVPETFEPLEIGPVTFGEPRLPGSICTGVVNESGTGAGTSAAANTSVQPGTSFSFELTEGQGAALVTKCRTYRADIVLEAPFEEYTKRHYNSWVALARMTGYGNDIKPVLVSGVDMTRDFAMMAYSTKGTPLPVNFTTSVLPSASTSTTAWGIWKTKGKLVHTNCGPQLQSLLPLPHEPSPDANTTEIPKEFNQCVFIRYYTIRWMAFFIPKVIKAAAGPDDLGPGDNRGGTSPKLAVQSGSDPDSGLEQSILTGSEPGEVRDEFDDIAERIFQYSSAQAILLHHHDIARIREGILGAGLSEVPHKRPLVVHVDNDGVGMLVWYKNQQQSEIPFKSLPECATEHNRDLDVGDVPGNTPAGTTNRLSLKSLVTEQQSQPDDSIYHRSPGGTHGHTGGYIVGLPSGTHIPQRVYCQGTPIPVGTTPRHIAFSMLHHEGFPADRALAGECGLLLDGDDAVFPEPNHTINLRIEWPGYDGWGGPIVTVNFGEIPRPLSRAKLVKEIAKCLEKFIQEKESTPIDPRFVGYKVGPGGIELSHISIVSLEQVSGDSWQPRLVYERNTIVSEVLAGLS